jgi:membrane protease YdiL (CAAX protease family)
MRRAEAVVLAAALLYPSLLAYLYFVALARPAGGGTVPAVQAAWGLGKLLEVALPLLWLRCAEGRWLGPGRPTLRGLAWGVGSGLAVAAVLLLLYYGVLRQHHLFREAPYRVRQKVVEFGLGSPAAFLAFAALLSVAHSFLEEYYWRWFLFGRLRRYLPVAGAVVVSSGAFMAFHLIDLAAFFPGRFFRLALPLGICVGIGGAGWCWLYARTNSLYVPWVSHLLIDAALMAVGYDLAFMRPT